MALKQADRVRETSTTTGTGAVALGGAPSGYRTFSSALSNGDQCTYAIVLDADWEVGLGTYNTSGNTLSRTTVLASSNSGSAVNFGAGSKSVFITPLASDAAFSSVLRVPAGAVGSPAVQANDDANTGVLFPAPDTVAASTGGVEALRINSSQEVIVGNGDAVASPASRTLRGTDGSGTNVAGGNLTIQAGRGTGNAAGGYIRFMTSPAGTSGTTLQTATERARVDSDGRIGIKTTPTLRSDVVLGGTTASDSANSLCFAVENTIPSTTTSQAQVFRSSANTQAASFTLSNLSHFICGRTALGAGSTVVNEHGYHANLTLIGATNEYGFYGNIPSGTGRWNFYAAGTAANYFAGVVQLEDGSASAPSLVNNGDENTGQWFPAADTIAWSTGGTERMRINASGYTQFSSNLVMPYQPAHTTKTSAATLTGAELITGVLHWNTSNSATVTLPSQGDIEAALTWAANNVSLDWFAINGGAGTLTIAASAGMTTVGSLIVAGNSAAHFRIRRTAANTFTIYRLS